MNSLRKFIPPPTVHFSTFCFQGVIVIRHLNTSMGADFAQSVSRMSLRHFWLLPKVVTCVLSQPHLNDGWYKSTGEGKLPLCWWRDNEHHFPQLAQCVCNMLAIPGMSTLFIYIIIHLLHDVQDHWSVLNEH